MRFSSPLEKILSRSSLWTSGRLLSTLALIIGSFSTPVSIPAAYAEVIVGISPVALDLVSVLQADGLLRFDCAPRGVAVTVAPIKTPRFDNLLRVSGPTVQLIVNVKELRHRISQGLIGPSKGYTKVNFTVTDSTHLALYRIEPFDGCESWGGEISTQSDGSTNFASRASR